MAHQQAPVQTVREEERVLGIGYERALAMVPRLVRAATGAEPNELGDGYFVASLVERSMKREVTVRLGRQGPDTRFSVRVESYSHGKAILLFILFATLTLGLGMLVALPWMIAMQRREARERDLLVHKTFRAIEDAVAEQGAAGSYRIGPGADAAIPEEEELAESTGGGGRARA